MRPGDATARLAATGAVAVLVAVLAWPLVAPRSAGAGTGATTKAGAAATTETRAVVAAALRDRLAVLDRARTLLAEKYRARRDDLRRHVRASYKMLRAGHAPLWIDAGERTALPHRRAAARRVLARDRVELDLLADEILAAETTRDQVIALLDALERPGAGPAIAAPAPGSLRPPVHRGRIVADFGGYRHAASGARLTRRGVWIASHPGRNVRAVADGRVRYTGPARGIGAIAIVDHGDYTSILGPLDRIAVTPDHPVERGAILGEASGDRVYLEIRLDITTGGFPIDPAPLLGRR